MAAKKETAAAPAANADKKKAIETAMQQIEKMDLYHRKDNPKRRRKKKQARCLCDRCRLDEACCPRSVYCLKEQEAV